MKNAKFKELRNGLGLSQSELAEVFGTTDRAVRRWESNAQDGRGPNPMGAILLLLIQDEVVTVEQVKAYAKAQKEFEDENDI